MLKLVEGRVGEGDAQRELRGGLLDTNQVEATGN